MPAAALASASAEFHKKKPNLISGAGSQFSLTRKKSLHKKHA
jgi:hypothetical protein